MTETGCGVWPTKPLEATCTTATSPTSYVSVDVWQLLGCAASPVEAEMEEIWSLPTKDMIRRSGQNNTNVPPARASIKRRLKRIHGLRMERISGASRHGVTIGRHVRRNGTTEMANENCIHSRLHEPHLLGKSYSMLDDPLAGLIGKGIDPIPIEDDDLDGYDSDPEIINSSSSNNNNNSYHSPQSSSSLYPQPALVKQHEIMQSEPLPFDETEMKISVQRSLNTTWTLTWHPNPDNVSQYNIPHKPICVNIWIERGTVIASSGVVVEPAFMWRDAYQPMLGQHKLNSSTQKPWSMRLLNACRITPCTTTIDRTKYPLARQQSSFFLKSCTGEEFLLEANGRTEVETITERWKLAVARFASLAVTEDVTCIAKEFFHPTVDSQMLTIPEDF
ncbi:hypothetical protein IV203_015981 [Nitzschia inconspicua]|uniref:Uncharacterized protein n=1 Tax=Nitzschia inconspicua TaxID=303405 RepID=A0A9K3PHT3_9STRA|nr:hypothetical protein IV203_015981 [Nitzschia inconspicua]